MIGFTVSNDTLLDRVVQMAAGKSERWQRGFHRCIAAFNATAGQRLARAYGLPDELVANNSQRGRVAQADEYLLQGDLEAFQGYLSGWLAVGARQDYLQIVSAESPGLQASDDLRRAMFRFLNDGKLDRSED
jgi:hypothetical protein